RLIQPQSSDARALEAQVAERLEEPARDDHVHAQLREAVEPAAELVQQARPGEADRREEVGDFRADLDRHLAVFVRGRPLDSDAEETLVAAGGRDEQAALDPPGHAAARRLYLVVRWVEADQHEGAAEEDDLA